MLSLKRGPSFNRPSTCKRPDSHTCFFLMEMWLFPSIFLHPFRFLFLWTIEYVVRSLLFFRMVFFYFVTTGWIFDMSHIIYVRIQSNQSNVIQQTVVFIYGHHILYYTDQPGKKGCQFCSWSSEQRQLIIPLSPYVPESLVSRHRFSRPVPRQPSHTQAESCAHGIQSCAHGIPPDFRGGVHLFILNRHTPSGQSRVYRVTQLRNDGVHCRESAGTGPVNLKVVPVTGAAILQVAMDESMCATLFLHPLQVVLV